MLATQLPIHSRTSHSGSPGGLLGPPGSELMLRICGGSHRGRVVKIRSAKCTVGSAPGCTLRLRADGIAPLHSWILRGPRGAVVRRATGYSLLNGQRFDDAPLRGGDRLVFGSVELEVVGFGECPLLEPAPTFPSHAPIAELEACLAAANEDIARLEADAQQAWQTSVVASERAEQMCEALERANVQIGEITAELESTQAELKRRSGSQSDQRAHVSRLEGLLEASHREVAVARQALVEAQTASAERTSHAQRLEAECNARDRRVEQLERELTAAQHAAREAAARAVTGPATIVMSDLQAEIKASEELQACNVALEAEVSRLTTELRISVQDRDAALSASARLLQAERQVEQWQDQSNQRQLRLDELSSRLNAVERQLRDSQAKAEQLERDNQQLQQQIGPLQKEAELARERQAQLEEQAGELDRAQDELDAAATALQSQQQSLEARQHELAAAQQTLQSDREAWLREEQELRRQLNEREAAARDHELQLSSRAQLLQAEAERTQQQQLEINELRGRLEGETADEATRQRQLDDLAAELAERSEKLDEREALLSRRHQELAAEQAAWQAERDACQAQPPVSRDSDSVWLAPASGVPHETAFAAAEAPAVDPNLEQEEVSEGAAPAGNPRDSSSMDSVLGRLVKAGLWRNPDEEAQAAEPAPDLESEPESPAPNVYQPPKSFLPPEGFVDDAEEAEVSPVLPFQASPEAPLPTPGAAKSATAGDEESIESYMERLMMRVRGDGSKPGATSSAPASHFAPEPSGAAPTTQTEAPAPKTDVKPEEFLPRAQAPEASVNMAAMRELANSAARSAIATHQQKHTSKRATGKLIGSAAVLAISLLLCFLAWYAWSLAAAIGAALGLAVSGWGMSAGLWRLLQSMQLKQPGEKRVVEREAPQAAPAVPAAADSSDLAVEGQSAAAPAERAL